MTTVIATEKGIYADTQCSYSVPFNVSKVARIGKSIWAGAGDMDDLQKFFDWVNRGGKSKDIPSFDDGIDVLEVCVDGIFLWGKKFVRLKVNNQVYAVGSGAQYAMGAIAAGATPKQAMEIAASLDTQTGSSIEFVKLDEGSRKKKRAIN